MGKKCELCGGAARMYCESDQASLCWDCDGKVHGANFLVAKHTRCLLCSACQSPTPWKAAGQRLGPTVSVCSSCVSIRNGGNSQNLPASRSQETNGHDYDEDRFAYDDDEDGAAESYDDDEEDEEDEEDGDDDEDDDDEDAENQVVPWATASAQQQPPVVSSSSSVSSGEEASYRGGGGLAVKRTRGNSDLLCSDDELGCSSPYGANHSRSLKRQSRDEHGESASRSTATINSIMRLHRQQTSDGHDAPSALVCAISNMSRDQSR